MTNQQTPGRVGSRRELPKKTVERLFESRNPPSLSPINPSKKTDDAPSEYNWWKNNMKRMMNFQGKGGHHHAGGGERLDLSAIMSRMSARTGAIVLKSVSIFLTSGRKASVNSKKPITEVQNPRRRIRRKMPDDANIKTYYAKVVETLRKKTRFSRIELEALCKIYRKLTSLPGQQKGSGIFSKGPQTVQTVEGIDRTIFRELIHNTFDIITEDTLIERMFCCWDRECEGAIRLESWITGLDIFLRGNVRDKMEFCFRVYDLNGDGYITKDEMFQLFKNCLIKQPGEEDPDEGVRDLSELALKKLDVDHDGKVSFADYEAAIKEEPLLLEAFGQCLPTEESCNAFLITLQP